MTYESPLLSLPGAVAGDGVDAGVAAHYGSLFGEQRTLAAGDGFVDLSHREVFRVAGKDRLTWLHSLTTQFFEGLEPGRWVQALVLSPQGHVEHAFAGVDDGEAFTAHTEPGRAAALVTYLERMKFWSEVEVSDVTADLAVAWRPGPASGRYDLVPRDQLEQYAEAAGPAAGLWAFEALRIERGEPRFGIDTDERTIPNEVGWLEAGQPWAAVHLDKGCYRGQETVARVNNLGRPPRRLTLLHLDGSENRLPAQGAPVVESPRTPDVEGAAPDVEELAQQASRDAGNARTPRPIGFIGSSARHHELGPIALALVKRNVEVAATLQVDGMPAEQETVVDPEVGLHFRRR